MHGGSKCILQHHMHQHPRRDSVCITGCRSSLAPPPDATEAEISNTVAAWFRYHPTRVIDGVVQCLDPDQTVPQYAQDWTDYARAFKSWTPDDSRKAKKKHEQLPAKNKSPTANTETKTDYSSGPTENAPTTVVTENTPPAAEEMDANPLPPAENATIKIDTQGDTVEDPIVIDESTSNSDSDSAQDADNNNPKSA